MKDSLKEIVDLGKVGIKFYLIRQIFWEIVGFILLFGTCALLWNLFKNLQAFATMF